VRLFWQAYYYDGRTARRHEVEVSASPEGLVIKKNGSSIRWPFDDVVQTQGANEGEPARLERGSEALIVDDPEFIRTLREIAPKHGRKFLRPERAGKGLYVIPAAALVTLSVAAVAYSWAIPAAVSFAARHVPPSVEERLGRSFVEGVTDIIPECSSPELRASVERILQRLDAATPANPYDFRLYILDDPMVNAFAAPGGHIVLFSGLIEATESPEELSGVMAHEMEHVLQRHSTQGMLQGLSTGILFSLAFGDFSGISGAAGTLGSLSYSRELEDEADRKGAELLVNSGTDPNGLVTFFERMRECECKDKDAESAEAYLSYLSTHPSTASRVESIKKHIANTPRTKKTEPILPDVDWKAVRSSCSKG